MENKQDREIAVVPAPPRPLCQHEATSRYNTRARQVIKGITYVLPIVPIDAVGSWQFSDVINAKDTMTYSNVRWHRKLLINS